MNHNQAEYHVAVNADIHGIQVVFADEDDRVVSKQLGAKGVGEIGVAGINPEPRKRESILKWLKMLSMDSRLCGKSGRAMAGMTGV